MRFPILHPSLSRAVRIKNRRLSIVYSLLVILCLAAVIADFLVNERWSSVVASEDGFSLSLTAVEDVDAINQVFESNKQAPMCVDSTFDYQWDPAGDFVYKNMSCKTVCWQANNPDCVPITVAVDLTDTSFFLATYAEERLYNKSGRIEHITRYFLPLEDAISIRFSYAYVARSLAPSFDNVGFAETFECSSRTNTLTSHGCIKFAS